MSFLLILRIHIEHVSVEFDQLFVLKEDDVKRLIKSKVLDGPVQFFFLHVHFIDHRARRIADKNNGIRFGVRWICCGAELGRFLSFNLFVQQDQRSQVRLCLGQSRIDPFYCRNAAVLEGRLVFCGKVANEFFLRRDECPAVCVIRFCSRRIPNLL